VPATGIYCNQCGWKNPPAARFCSACGAPLQAVASPAQAEETPRAAQAPQPPPDADDEVEEADDPGAASPKAVPAAGDHKAVSRQVGIIVGAGVLLVVALFLVTAVSKMRPVSMPAPAAQGAPLPTAVPEGTPLPAELAEQAAAIEGDLEQLDGAARIARQRDLIALFYGAGRMDRAALEQEKIAQATGTVDDWKRAGDLFYDWMNTMPDGGGKVPIATRAVKAYQTVLEQDPDNLDVRTDLATAYLSSGSPMEGVAEIKRVLDADPNHLHARFNYGLMLTWINRSDQAIEQFERVKSLVDESSDYYRRADEAIRAIREG
jgi:tetratricopeptide (TPR) repeat protein